MSEQDKNNTSIGIDRIVEKSMRFRTMLQSLASELRHRSEQDLRELFSRLLVGVGIDYITICCRVLQLQVYIDHALLEITTFLLCDRELIKEIVLDDEMYRIVLPSLYESSKKLVVTIENMLQLIDEIKNGQKEKIDELNEYLRRFSDDISSITKSLKCDQHE